MKIMINRKIIEGPWGGGNLFVKGVLKELKSQGHNVYFDFVEDLDYIFIINPMPSEYGYDINQILQYKSLFPAVKLVHRINECEKRKGLNNGLDHILTETAKRSDIVIFISDWLKQYFYKKGYTGKSHVIYNGCDSKYFNFKEALDKPSNTNQVHLVTHHWSNHIFKGYDFYQELDEILTDNKWKFTFIGRYHKNFSPKNINLIPPKSGKELADELKKANIYITASKWEPCGMHHIEGAACGLPVLYHVDGGGINEGCKRYGEGFKSIDTFKNSLNKIVKNYENYISSIKSHDLTMEKCCKDYINLLK
tara:strand:- start:5229 stop:6152 length:924 start_codon:yes stop_codon:yes gene_type:complete